MWLPTWPTYLPTEYCSCGRGGGGPGRRGRPDGGCGRGGRVGPLPCRKRNPMLTSSLRNSALVTSISPLPCTLAPLAAVPPPPPAVAGPQYTTAIVQVQDCGNPRRANPLLRRTTESRGPGKKEKCGDGTTEEGALQTAVSLSAALPPREGGGLTIPLPHSLPFGIPMSPSLLGLTFAINCKGSGMRITNVDPTCEFWGWVAPGGTNVTINGRRMRMLEDATVGREQAQEFGIFSRASAVASVM